MTTTIPHAAAALFEALMGIKVKVEDPATFLLAPLSKPIATVYVDMSVFMGLKASLVASVLIMIDPKDRNSILINNIRFRPRLRRPQ